MPHKLHTQIQDLREAIASIISMMLGLLRAQGWRGLLHLPEIVLVVFLLRSISKRFAALMEAHAAGTLPLFPPPSIAPPPIAPPDRQVAPPATPRVRAHQSASHRHRNPAPAKPARAGVRARTRAVARPFAPKPFPAPFVLVRAADPQKNPILPMRSRTPNSLRYRTDTPNPRARPAVSGSVIQAAGRGVSTASPQRSDATPIASSRN